jgi:3-deoxy-D-manno-octulosonate 8-phosphate phosphatase (KDO 8-P phosphatase)
VAVANAHPWVAEHAHWTTGKPGGMGAAREVCDLILLAQGKADAERERWQ